ncbi:phosphotransferase enzyme family protein [Jiangella asiatica]|uniref:Aminoglycoside phosphotransferase domain-containing protein n=1 Tax=Jiangella asiatica TaxID=2530372 RepID=A0A4R5CLL6_9ACTN|nr:phosphotransferase [Jiangella asiatica]TDE00157.1 hypothetical protein E1269_26435 [Jiangella asiatica]
MWGAETQDHVARHGRGLAPAVVPTRDGELAVNLGSCRLSVSEWVDGRQLGEAPEGWSAAGRALGRLHRITRSDHEFGIPVDAAVDEIRAQVSRLPFAGRAVDLVRRIQDMPLIPVSTIHGEPAASNLLHVGPDSAVLLDWDESGYGPVVLDLGFPLINEFLSHDLRFNGAAARAFYGAYRREAGFLPTSAGGIFTAALFHALRSMMFHDLEARWRRIVHAVDHEQELINATLTPTNDSA